MNTEAYYKVMEIERAGEIEKALSMLKELAREGDALALLDLSARYYSVDGYAYPVESIDPDHTKSEELLLRAKERFEELSSEGSGEAMRMLASIYFGHWGPFLEKSVEKAEQYLLRAIEAKCFFAANDLATFYQGSNIEKAKYYYQMAEEHNCRVIHNEDLET